MSKVSRSRSIREQDRDFGAGETLRLEPLDDAFGLTLGGGDAEYGFGHFV
jgi:hypothetical protein